ncbi:hypothetical protein GFB49_11210 [Epibacterium sp. SM1979]|uniref:Uncharacterized protein n=1 Tax=Tritonibacter litoralis TaxID=2662264 RepID=A0A843YHW8_9RHOB|nr:hypothetical protein [Tritonibacter litoralis]MQQ09024.1 hypothetical protein [Tritonibacter litoralis]
MAPINDPMTPVENQLTTLHRQVEFYYKKLWKRISASVAPLCSFLKNVISAAKKLAQTVGKAAVDSLITTGRFVLNLIDNLATGLRQLWTIGKHILTGFKRKLEADRAKLIRVLKTKLRNFVVLFRKIFAWVNQLWDQIAPLDRALAILAQFRGILKLVLGWIADVTQVMGALNKIKQLMRKIWKPIKREVKSAIQLGKDIARMPVPKSA